jgi:BNR repeat-like domain
MTAPAWFAAAPPAGGQEACAAPPAAPRALTAVVRGMAVILSWRPAATGCHADTYRIEAGSRAGATDLPPIENGLGTTVTLADVEDGLYFARVRAINAAGVSAPSNEVRVSVGNSTCGGGKSPAPNGIFPKVTGATIELVWNPSPRAPNGYRVDIGSSPDSSDLFSGWTAADDRSLTVTTAGADTFFIRVRARNACGIGRPSFVVTVPGGHPSQPDVVIRRRSGQRNVYFPTVERLKNGHLILVYYDSPAHTSPEGRISLMKSVDDGRTWSAPVVAVDSPFDDRDPSIMQSATGALLLSYFSVDSTDVSPSPGIFVVRSEDEGATWSVPAKVDTALTQAGTSAKIVQLENGTLVIPVYGAAGTFARSAVLRSTDDGRTWSGEVRIDSASTVDLVEPAIASLGGGRLMAMMRSERSDSVSMESRSSDGGLTWSEPVKTGFLAHGSDLLPVGRGTSAQSTLLVHAWGDWSRRFGASRAALVQLIELPEPLGTAVYGAPHVVYNIHCDDMASPSAVRLGDGRLFIVYYDACSGLIGGNYLTVDALRR